MIERQLNALIICPEITKGMKSIGSKSLLPIKNNKCVLDYQITCLKNIDPNIRIAIATGFESDKIEFLSKQYKNIDCIYNIDYKTTNQASSLRKYLEKYQNINNLLILCSGVIFKNKCIKRSMLDMSSKIFLLNKQKENFTLGCSTNNTIEYLFYGLPETWSECVYLNEDSISWLNLFIKKNSIDQMYIFEILNEILNNKIYFSKQLIDKKDIIKITNQKDIKKAKVFI